jgi:starch synthase (maltosyl-transferring)
MLVYNLFPLLAGRFTEWGPHLERAAELGFDWIFVNPVQRPGHSGSLYSIADYFDFHPRLVTGTDGAAELRAAITATHRHGLRAMTDLVVNHSAVDSPLTQQHPEWYRMEHGRIANPSCVEEGGHRVVWQDLAQFDHAHSRDRDGLHDYFVRVVDHLLALGFDGFRCDAAYQVPPDVWRRLIASTRARRSDVCFVAETLGCTPDQTRETASCGFDYVFNSAKYWNFHDHWLMEQYNLVREIVPSIAFPESHDTPRLADELQGNVDGLKQRYLFSGLFSGGVMTLMGFEFGFRRRPHVVHTTPEEWEPMHVDLRDFIRRVNHVKRTYGVFQEDAPTQILPYHDPNVLVLWKGSTRNRDEALIVLNKDIWGRHDFWCEDLRHWVQSGAPLACVSPENPLEYVHHPFHYELRPGEAVVLVTTR